MEPSIISSHFALSEAKAILLIVKVSARKIENPYEQCLKLLDIFRVEANFNRDVATATLNSIKESALIIRDPEKQHFILTIIFDEEIPFDTEAAKMTLQAAYAIFNSNPLKMI